MQMQDHWKGHRWIASCKLCSFKTAAFAKDQRQAFRQARKKHGRREKCHTPSLECSRVQEDNHQEISLFALLLTNRQISF